MHTVPRWLGFISARRDGALGVRAVPRGLLGRAGLVSVHTVRARQRLGATRRDKRLRVCAVPTQFFSSAYGKAACSPCPGALLAPPGSEACCAKGSYLDGQNCTACPAGTVFINPPGFSAADTCAPCPVGTWSGAIGFQGLSGPNSTAPCNVCPANTFAPTTGSTDSSDCLPCGASLGSPAGAGVCCAAGFWSAPFTALCVACPAGTRSSIKGAGSASTCRPCGAGQFSNAGSPTCSACAPGTEPDADKGACVPCGGEG